MLTPGAAVIFAAAAGAAAAGAPLNAPPVRLLSQLGYSITCGCGDEPVPHPSRRHFAVEAVVPAATRLKHDDDGDHATPPHLNGIFLSLSANNADFSAAQWRAEFEAMRAVKLEFFVIRSLLNGANSYTTGGCVMGHFESFYNSTLTPAECYKRVGSAGPGGTLGIILEQAAIVGLGVHALRWAHGPHAFAVRAVRPERAWCSGIGTWRICRSASRRMCGGSFHSTAR